MNLYHLLLEMIWMRSIPSSLNRVLESLGYAAGQCDKAIGKAMESGNDEYVEVVLADESAVTENLIGAALVSCQAEITAVASYARRAKRHRTPVRDKTLNLVRDFTPKECYWWEGGSIKIPDAKLFVGN